MTEIEDRSGFWRIRPQTAVAIGITIIFERLGLFAAVGVYLQQFWSYLFDWCDGDSACLTLGLGTLIPQGLFWSFNAFFILVEVFQGPAFIRKYKIQDTAPPLTWKQFGKCFILSAFNMTVMWHLTNYITYKSMMYRGCDFTRELPGLTEFAYNAIIIAVVEECGFYYFHRMLHLPVFYKRIHKIHHEFTAPIGLASVYSHPFEHLLSNVLPVMLGPVLAGSHVSVLILWYSVALVQTTISHCGYHLPFMPSSEQHDYHHLMFNQNFGVMGWLDTLHGTNAQFVKSVQGKRHHTLWTLTPVKDIIPDSDKSM